MSHNDIVSIIELGERKTMTNGAVKFNFLNKNT